MNVSIPIQTIEELFGMLHKYDAAMERFITELSTGEKYELLALIMMVRNNYEDFEEAHAAAMSKIPEQGLTKYFMERSSDNWQLLHCELQDVISIQKKYGWDWFEVAHSNDDDDDDENTTP